MKYETRNGNHTAEIIVERLNGERKFPVVVILTNKKTGRQEVEAYTELLTIFGEVEDGFDLVEVQP